MFMSSSHRITTIHRDGHGAAPRRGLNVTVGGRLHGFDECLAGRTTFETAKLLGRNDD
jgi:hypothetical protein